MTRKEILEINGGSILDAIIGEADSSFLQADTSSIRQLCEEFDKYREQYWSEDSGDET